MVGLLLCSDAIGVLLLYSHVPYHNDTIIKQTQEGRLLYKYIYLSLYCKGSKELFRVCM